MMRHCPRLKENDILILSRDPEKRMAESPYLWKHERIRFLKGDVRDFTFPQADFDYIFHGATTSGKIIPDDEMLSVVNDGTRRVLEFALRNTRLSNLLYVSSGAVYKNMNRPMSEDDDFGPINIYGRSKLDAEKLCLASGVPISIARCFAFVGEYLPLDVHFAIGNFILDCLKNRPIVIKGDGSPLRTYLYSGDLAHWLWTIMVHGKCERAYNVGSDQEISIAGLAEAVRQVAGTTHNILTLSPPTGKPPDRYTPNIRRARSELGLHVTTSLKEAVRRTLAYHKTKEKTWNKKLT